MPLRRVRTPVPCPGSPAVQTTSWAEAVLATAVLPAVLLPVALVAALALTAPAAAQEPHPSGDPPATDTLVPLEFVRVVSGGRDMPPSRLLIGELVGPLGALLDVPANARVVGSTRAGSSAFSAIAMPGSMAAAWIAGAAVLESAGFERTVSGPPPSGFVASRENPGNLFCHGDSLAVRITARQWDGQSYVLLRTTLPGSRPPCVAPTPGRSILENAPIPSLFPPTGATSMGHGSGGVGGAWEAQGLIESDLGLPALLDHYDAQLRGEGWAPDEARDGDMVGIRSYRFNDERGDAWRGILSGVRLDDSRHLVQIRVIRVGDWPF